jgi:hypothetical protein
MIMTMVVSQFNPTSRFNLEIWEKRVGLMKCVSVRPTCSFEIIILSIVLLFHSVDYPTSISLAGHTRKQIETPFISITKPWKFGRISFIKFLTPASQLHTHDTDCIDRKAPPPQAVYYSHTKRRSMRERKGSFLMNEK